MFRQHRHHPILPLLPLLLLHLWLIMLPQRYHRLDHQLSLGYHKPQQDTLQMEA
jgi:hypothetical protein